MKSYDPILFYSITQTTLLHAINNILKTIIMSTLVNNKVVYVSNLSNRVLFIIIAV